MENLKKIKLSEKQKQQIEVFKAQLLEKNQAINLFSRKNPEQQIKLLFEQAFLTGKSLAPAFNQAKGPVLDIGSGNGFPGLFMGILYPELIFYLCERNRKKAEFLKYVLAEADILNIKVLCKSAEGIRERFLLILSQAALPTAQMLKLLTKLLSQRGEAFLWKGPHWEKDWPNKAKFTHEVFNCYKMGSSKNILLRLRKTEIST